MIHQPTDRQTLPGSLAGLRPGYPDWTLWERGGHCYATHRGELDASQVRPGAARTLHAPTADRLAALLDAQQREAA